MPRRLTGGFALALTTLVAGSGTVAALPAPGDEPGYDPAQPEVTLEIKFDEALAVRGADDQLRSQRGRSLARVETALARYAGYQLQPLVPVAADRLDEVAARAQERAGASVPDLSSWYSLTLTPDVDAEAVAAELEELPEVVYAYPAPEPVPPPRASETDTPDFTSLQTYFGPSAASDPDSNGIDADFTRADPRLRGEGIKIVDLEYDWNPFHEDLQLQTRPEPDTANLAPVAAVACSYTSPWESCDAINSGVNPGSSNIGSPNDGTRWGTWPEGGSHWTSDWESPELARHAADEALSVMSRGLYANDYNGLVAKGEPVLDPEVSSVDPPSDPSKVVISDCGDSSNWLMYDAETGELADEQPGGRRAITAVVEQQPDGSWKVTGFAVRELGSC